MTPTVTHLDKDIFTIASLFTPDECRALIERGEAIGFEAATIRTQGQSQMMTAIRNNDRAVFDDPAMAESVWERVKGFVPAEIDGCRATGLYPSFAFIATTQASDSSGTRTAVSRRRTEGGAVGCRF